MSAAPRLYTVKQTADMLGKKPRWARDPKLNPIPFIKIGRTKMFELADIQAYVRDHRVDYTGISLTTSRTSRRAS